MLGKEGKTKDGFNTIYDYLKKSYPDATVYELKEMEKEVMAYQQMCHDLENSDDYF